MNLSWNDIVIIIMIIFIEWRVKDETLFTLGSFLKRIQQQ